MNSLGWSRRDPDLPVNTAQQTGGLLSSIKSLNPWGDSGYVRLPTTEGPGAPLPARNRREEEEAWFACESTPMVFHLPMSHSPCISYLLYDSRGVTSLGVAESHSYHQREFSRLTCYVNSEQMGPNPHLQWL
jgi:hypothetical protein